jgi:hypothetical protein
MGCPGDQLRFLLNLTLGPTVVGKVMPWLGLAELELEGEPPVSPLWLGP